MADINRVETFINFTAFHEPESTMYGIFPTHSDERATAVLYLCGVHLCAPFEVFEFRHVVQIILSDVSVATLVGTKDDALDAVLSVRQTVHGLWDS